MFTWSCPEPVKKGPKESLVSWWRKARLAWVLAKRRKRSDCYSICIVIIVPLIGPCWMCSCVCVPSVDCTVMNVYCSLVGTRSRRGRWSWKTAECRWPIESARRARASTSPWRGWTEAGWTSVRSAADDVMSCQLVYVDRSWMNVAYKFLLTFYAALLA